jgi:tripartite-type tricarboxylate transporter receptor subunit TctC
MLAILVAGNTGAQDYPNRPIRWIVPFSAGSGSDSAARLIADKLPAHLGQPVVIENRPGAGGVLGTEIASRARADGYTLLWGGIAPLAINVTMQKKLPYDPLKDFQPITRVALAPLLLVASPSLRIHSVEELIALAKSRPGQLSYASPGNGTTSHISMELLKTTSHTSISHIPYKGTTPAVTDLVAGHVNVMIDSVAALAPHVNAGKLVPLAVTSSKRVAAMPNVPTMIESGFAGFDTQAWMGVLVPTGTPAHAVEKLRAALQKVLTAPDVQTTMFEQWGFEVSPTTPEQFSSFIRSEISKWAQIITTTNAKVE